MGASERRYVWASYEKISDKWNLVSLSKQDLKETETWGKKHEHKRSISQHIYVFLASQTSS